MAKNKQFPNPKSDKCPWESLTIPGHYMNGATYVIDCFFYYNHKYRDMSYKDTRFYGGHLFKKIYRLIKYNDIAIVVEALANSKLMELKDYTTINWHINETKAKYARLEKPKDTSETTYTEKEVEDLRPADTIPKTKKKTRLEMLEDL